MHHALQSNKESGASCPAIGRLTHNDKPAVSSQTTQDGSRVNNPVFHAPQCEILAHTHGKRYAWQLKEYLTG